MLQDVLLQITVVWTRLVLGTKGVRIDPSSRVQTSKIGSGTRIWAYVNIMKGVNIGKDCNICDRCFLESGVIVGDRVTIKTGVSLWTGVVVGSDVFIGPNVSFCNDDYPVSRHYKEPATTVIEDGSSIGSGAVILPSVIIGKGAMIGAGSVVTKSVPPYTVVAGNPAKVLRQITSTSQ